MHRISDNHRMEKARYLGPRTRPNHPANGTSEDRIEVYKMLEIVTSQKKRKSLNASHSCLLLMDGLFFFM